MCVCARTQRALSFTNIAEMFWKEEILHDGIEKQLIVSPSVFME